MLMMKSSLWVFGQSSILQCITDESEEFMRVLLSVPVETFLYSYTDISDMLKSL